MGSILENLSETKIKKDIKELARRIARPISIAGIVSGLVLLPISIGLKLGEELAKGKYSDNLIEVKKISEESPLILKEYLKDNIQIMNSFLTDYEGRRFLEDEIIYSAKSKEDTICITSQGIIYDKDKGIIYNPNGGELRIIKTNVRNLFSYKNSFIFSTQKEVFMKDDNKNKIKKIMECGSPLITPIYGTGLCIIKSGFDASKSLLINLGEDNESVSKIEKILKANLKEDIFNQQKLSYDDDSLYSLYKNELSSFDINRIL